MTVAKLMGISVNRSFALAWAMGSMAGVVAGLLVAPILFLDVNMMGALLIKGFAGAVLGGLSSLGGVFVGGLLLGVVENLMGAYVSGSFGEAKWLLKDRSSARIAQSLLGVTPEVPTHETAANLRV